jgi:hypothetical protein
MNKISAALQLAKHASGGSHGRNQFLQGVATDPFLRELASSPCISDLPGERKCRAADRARGSCAEADTTTHELAQYALDDIVTDTDNDEDSQSNAVTRSLLGAAAVVNYHDSMGRGLGLSTAAAMGVVTGMPKEETAKQQLEYDDESDDDDIDYGQYVGRGGGASIAVGLDASATTDASMLDASLARKGEAIQRGWAATRRGTPGEDDSSDDDEMPPPADGKRSKVDPILLETDELLAKIRKHLDGSGAAAAAADGNITSTSKVYAAADTAIDGMQFAGRPVSSAGAGIDAAGFGMGVGVSASIDAGVGSRVGTREDIGPGMGIGVEGANMSSTTALLGVVGDVHMGMEAKMGMGAKIGHAHGANVAGIQGNAKAPSQHSSAQAALDAAVALQSVLAEDHNTGQQRHYAEQDKAFKHAQQVQQLAQQQAQRQAELKALQQHAQRQQAQQSAQLQAQQHAEQVAQRRAQQQAQLRMLQQAQQALVLEQQAQEQMMHEARTAPVAQAPVSPLRAAVLEAEASLKFALEQRNKQAAAAAQEAKAHAQKLMRAQQLAAAKIVLAEAAPPGARRRKRGTRQAPASSVMRAAAPSDAVAADWSRRQRATRSQTQAAVAVAEEERKNRAKINQLKLRLAGQKNCIDELTTQLKTREESITNLQDCLLLHSEQDQCRVAAPSAAKVRLDERRKRNSDALRHVEPTTSRVKGRSAKGKGKKLVRRRRRVGKKERDMLANDSLADSESEDEERVMIDRGALQQPQQPLAGSPHNHGVEKGLRSQISTLNAQLKTFQDRHQQAEQKCERVLLAARLQKKEEARRPESRDARPSAHHPPSISRQSWYDDDADDDDDDGSDYAPKGGSLYSHDEENSDRSNVPVVNEAQQTFKTDSMERAASLKAKMDR